MVGNFPDPLLPRQQSQADFYPKGVTPELEAHLQSIIKAVKGGAWAAVSWGWCDWGFNGRELVVITSARGLKRIKRQSLCFTSMHGGRYYNARLVFSRPLYSPEILSLKQVIRYSDNSGWSSWEQVLLRFSYRGQSWHIYYIEVHLVHASCYYTLCFVSTHFKLSPFSWKTGRDISTQRYHILHLKAFVVPPIHD